MSLYQEFKPTVSFLLRFVGIYVVGNLLYGWMITNYEPGPDPLTRIVTWQTVQILSLSGWSTTAVEQVMKPTIVILYQHKGIVSVFEGCNGINVVILFGAFLFALNPFHKSLRWFLPTGVVIIHVCNLLRISLLFLVALYFPNDLYFIHKYLFTAFIFLIVFLLWLWWVKRVTVRHHEE